MSGKFSLSRVDGDIMDSREALHRRTEELI